MNLKKAKAAPIREDKIQLRYSELLGSSIIKNAIEAIINNPIARPSAPSIQFIALIIPAISITGIVLFNILNKNRVQAVEFKTTRLDYQIFLGSCAFVIFTVFFGTLNIPFSREVILISSLLLIAILMRLLIKDLKKEENYFYKNL